MFAVLRLLYHHKNVALYSYTISPDFHTITTLPVEVSKLPKDIPQKHPTKEFLNIPKYF